MTLAKARRIARKWQERMRLVDWDVKVQWADKKDEADHWGYVSKDLHAKTATIYICHPRNKDWQNADRDIETIIVHELGHLYCAPFDFKLASKNHVAEEVFVNHVARLLVALDRRDESIMNGGHPLSRIAAIK